MSQWILSSAEKLEPLIDLLKATLLAQEVLFADETSLTVSMMKGRRATSGCMVVVLTEAVMHNHLVSCCLITKMVVEVTSALNRTYQSTVVIFRLMGTKRMRRQMPNLLAAGRTLDVSSSKRNKVSQKESKVKVAKSSGR